MVFRPWQPRYSIVEPRRADMTKKRIRQAAILDLIGSHVVGSQEELRQLLLMPVLRA